MTTSMPHASPTPPAAGLFGTGSGGAPVRAAPPRPGASPSQREGFAALFRLDGSNPHLA